jgi:hypothetical protein
MVRKRQVRKRQQGGFLTDAVNTGFIDHYGEHDSPKKTPWINKQQGPVKKQQGGFRIMWRKAKNAFW